MELYRTSYAILRPEILKIKDLFKYAEASTNLIALALRTIYPDYREGFLSDEFLYILAKSLDLIMTMDILKNGKASLNNDFSLYKRILSNLKNLVTNMEEETMENHALYTFLGTQNVFALKLKEKFNQVQGSDEILVDLANYCLSMYERKQFVTPESKHMLLKAMAFTLYLLDQDGEDRDITKKKRLKLDRFTKIFKVRKVAVKTYLNIL